METLAIIAIVVVLLFIALAFIPNRIRERTPEEEAEARRKSVELAAQQELLKQFEADLAQEWPVKITNYRPDARDFFLMRADQKMLRRLALKYRPSIEIEGDETFDISEVVSVEVQQSERTITRFETSSITKRPSRLRSAVVGGVLLGPVGAVGGAVLASRKTKTTGTMTGNDEVIRGPAYLVIGTTNILNPVVKVKVSSRETGEAWLHRIRGALTVAQSS